MAVLALQVSLTQKLLFFHFIHFIRGSGIFFLGLKYTDQPDQPEIHEISVGLGWFYQSCVVDWGLLWEESCRWDL